GRPAIARKYYKRLIPLLDKTTNGYSKARHQGIRAGIYIALGDYQKMRDTIEEELAFERKNGLTPFIPTTLSSLAQAEYLLGRSDKALELYREVLLMNEEAGDNLSRASRLRAIAEIEENKGDLEAAERDMSAAVAAVETVRTSLSGLSEA